MWRALREVGTPVREVRMESGARGMELVIVSASGERVRVPVAGALDIETVGRVLVRSAPRGDDERGTLTTFSGEHLELARADVAFDGDGPAWEEMWRRARARSRPWWHDASTDELDLDCAMGVRITLVAR